MEAFGFEALRAPGGGAGADTEGLADESDVFAAPRLVGEDGQVRGWGWGAAGPKVAATAQALAFTVPANPVCMPTPLPSQALEPRYQAAEQALLLAWATLVKKGTAQVCGWERAQQHTLAACGALRAPRSSTLCVLLRPPARPLLVPLAVWRAMVFVRRTSCSSGRWRLMSRPCWLSPALT